jgi:hypothetical protein
MIKHNPFSGYGGIVKEDRFIGRRSQIKLIQSRLLAEDNFGNLAIMGLPRVGKSSLAWNAVMQNKEDLINRKIIPIWLPFGEYSSLLECIESIMLDVIDKLKSLGIETFNLEECNHGFKRRISQLEKRRIIKKYFKILKNIGYRLLVILDEFDNAEKIMNLFDFQFLRELSYNPETKIAILTISRKTIREIEPNEGVLSNFHQIFTDLNLGLYNESDIYEYWTRVTSFGVSVSKEYEDIVEELVGSHPYLLDVLNYEVFNHSDDSGIDLKLVINSSMEALKLKLYNEYESIINLMRHENLDRMMLQMIVGPVYDISQRDIERLLRFGIVLSKTNDSYQAFAASFGQYLKIKSQEINIWPLWNEVEVEIRELIKLQLFEKYGENWEDGYRKEFKNKDGNVEVLDGSQFSPGLINERDRSIKLFGNLASNHLIDYTLPRQMFDYFISKDWTWYSKVFSKQKNDWKPVFEHLTKIRNPLAHNNPSFLSSSDKSIAEGYCEVILEKVQKWKSH